MWHFAGQPAPSETTEQHQDQYDQQYDQRGRPVNPTTRRINRDIIRAHNEVMLAIGVVEPEASWQETLAKQESVRRHRQAETSFAKSLLFVNGIIEKSVVWGVDGMRQRIMVSSSCPTPPTSPLITNLHPRYTKNSQRVQFFTCFAPGTPRRHGNRICLLVCPPTSSTTSTSIYTSQKSSTFPRKSASHHHTCHPTNTYTAWNI